MLILTFLSPLHKILVDLLTELLTAGNGNQSQCTYRDVLQVTFASTQHYTSSLFISFFLIRISSPINFSII